MEKPTALIVNAEDIPVELKQIPHWVLWRYVYRDPKWTKPPFQASGAFADATDPQTWTDFDTAYATYSTNKDFDGIGFVPNGEGIIGIDHDHVVVDGEVSQEALDDLFLVNSYCELSPSGTGTRCFAFAEVPPNSRCRNSIVEVYSSGRYFTVTGQKLQFSPNSVVHRHEMVQELLKKHNFLREGKAEPRISHPSADCFGANLVLAMIRSSAQAPKFEQLWSGNQASGSSHSEADAALVSLLAFWCMDNHALIDKLFRKSGLYRPKWDSPRGKSTYGAETIANMLSLPHDVWKYEPREEEGKLPISVDREFSPEEIASIEANPAFRFIDWRTVEPKATEWIVEDLIPSGACSILGAEMKTGKTWVSLHLALAVATGGKAFGAFQARPGRVLIYSPEGSPTNLSRRFWSLCWGHNIDPELCNDNVQIMPGPIYLDNPQSYRGLAYKVKSFRPDLLVLDPFINLHTTLDENAAEIHKLCTAIRSLQTFNRDMAILTCHHVNKAAKDHSAFHSLRGSSTIGGWADGLLLVRRFEDESGAPRRCDVHHRDDRSPESFGFILREVVMKGLPNKMTAMHIIPCEAPSIRKSHDEVGQRRDRIVSMIENSESGIGPEELKAFAEETGVTARTIRRDVSDLINEDRLIRDDFGRYRIK